MKLWFFLESDVHLGGDSGGVGRKPCPGEIKRAAKMAPGSFMVSLGYDLMLFCLRCDESSCMMMMS
jgi:hypothetical protein